MTNFKKGGFRIRKDSFDDEQFEVFPHNFGRKPTIKGAVWTEIATVSGDTKQEARANARLFANSDKLYDFCYNSHGLLELAIEAGGHLKALALQMSAERAALIRKVRGGK